MKIGLIARADDTGLGTQCREFFRHMAPAKTLVLDFCHESPKGLDLHPEWYPGATIHQGIPHYDEIEPFLDGLDAVFTAETLYNPVEFIATAKRLGVRTVVQPNWEFYVPTGPQPDLLAFPTSWHFTDVPHDNKLVLPCPIARDRWSVHQVPAKASRFLHVVGHPAVHDRAGTVDLLKAIRYIESEITITLRCQDPGHLGSLVRRTARNSRVGLVIDSSRMTNYWELYEGHDVMVLPRRYGGLCLPAQEALGAGLPVIMPDISPNDDLLPQQWLTPATIVKKFQVASVVGVYATDPRALAAKIDQFASDSTFYQHGVLEAVSRAEDLSWNSLKADYEEVLAGDRGR